MNLFAVVMAVVSHVVFAFADPAIGESSGLVDLGSLMVTTNDSGDDAVLYAIDPATGKTVGRTVYADVVIDVEALAPDDDGHVWAGDIGDNRRGRTSVTVYRVPVGSGDRRADATPYRLVYPEGPADAESLLYAGGRLYVITKAFSGGTVYLAPEHLDPRVDNLMQPVGRVGVWATDAALFNDGKHVLVRGYGSAEILTFPGFERVADLVLPAQQQGEGVSIGPGNRIRLSSEGAHSEVLEIELPADVQSAMGQEPTPSPTPTTSGAGAVPATPSSTSTWSPVLVIGAGLVLLFGVGTWVGRRRRR